MYAQTPWGRSVAFLRHFVLKALFFRGVKSLLALLLLFTFAGFFYRYGIYDDFYVSARILGHRGDTLNHGHGGWWAEFFARLEETRVTARALRMRDRGPSINWKPDIDATRPDLIQLREDDEAKFRQSHAAFVDQLALFASHLPYHANTTGIVTTAGVPNFGQVVSLVLMTRRAGSRLPIQIFLDSSSPWVDWVCSHTMPRFNAKCVSLEDTWGGMSRPLPRRLVRFQWKIVSIIGSTFQNVLFLDADCLPVLNPDPIFDRGAEPFTSAGFISWPDFWVTNTSPRFYGIAGDIEVPPVTPRTSPEAGMMVYDKVRHADTLLLAAYYNYNGPKHYYPLFSQAGAGEGDRESFLRAAQVLQALREKGRYKQPTAWMKPGVGVKKGYYDVKTLPTVHGRSAKGKWDGMFMMQKDPMADYRAVMSVIEEAKKKKEGSEAKSRPSANPPPPPPPPRWRNETVAPVKEESFLTDTTPLDTFGNLTLALKDHGDSRVMFFHHNGVDPDFTRILDRKSRMVETDEQGRYVRLWGDPGWMVDGFGRDVEKLLWKDSMQVYCQEGLARFWRLRKDTQHINEEAREGVSSSGLPAGGDVDESLSVKPQKDVAWHLEAIHPELDCYQGVVMVNSEPLCGNSSRRRSRSRSRSPARRPKVSKGFKWKDKRSTDDADDRGPRRDSYRDRSPRRDDRGRDRERDGDRYNNNNTTRHGDRYRDGGRDPRDARDRETSTRPPPKNDKSSSSDNPPRPTAGAGGGAAAAAQPKLRKPQQQQQQRQQGEEMIIVTVNDRLGTKAQIPAFPSDTVGQFKIMVAAKIGREPHEILLKRQGERPFKDHISLGDYGVSNGVQLDLEVDTGD
ncbi:mannosyltransferase putative-domain-containing protein [Chaetomium strumarium]|uniref:Mannosyltransferase putative-domain-containing protein n=1 Tax=Chaetomium strumarium TaxID=1170767 RepID=A0AAJ0M045_9PEZI|nr:mannosyltransferase putative-domain-containing protein [Chaetomium strumarium]